MARGADDLASSLPDIEGVVDRAARWVGENPGPFLGAIALVLALTGGIATARWWSERGTLAASEAVADVRAGFLNAMGAPAGVMTFTEPANPETGHRARQEYAARFAEVAAAHRGTAAAVEAWIEAGNLREQLGESDAALEALQRAVTEAPSGSPLRGLALARLASSYEGRGASRDAAASYEEAAGIAAFPLRHFAMADAARTYAIAGEHDRAVALADRVASEAPDLELPEPLRARLEELRASRAGALPGVAIPDSTSLPVSPEKPIETDPTSQTDRAEP